MTIKGSRSRVNDHDAYRDGVDRIFGPRKKVQRPKKESTQAANRPRKRKN